MYASRFTTFEVSPGRLSPQEAEPLVTVAENLTSKKHAVTSSFTRKSTSIQEQTLSQLASEINAYFTTVTSAVFFIADESLVKLSPASSIAVDGENRDSHAVIPGNSWNPEKRTVLVDTSLQVETDGFPRIEFSSTSKRGPFRKARKTSTTGFQLTIDPREGIKERPSRTTATRIDASLFVSHEFSVSSNTLSLQKQDDIPFEEQSATDVHVTKVKVAPFYSNAASSEEMKITNDNSVFCTTFATTPVLAFTSTATLDQRSTRSVETVNGMGCTTLLYRTTEQVIQKATSLSQMFSADAKVTGSNSLQTMETPLEQQTWVSNSGLDGMLVEDSNVYLKKDDKTSTVSAKEVL